MFYKILAACAILIAVVMGILAIVLPPENISFVIVISKFFEVMIPVLAVAALVKYLCKCCAHKHDKCCAPNATGYPPHQSL